MDRDDDDGDESCNKKSSFPQVICGTEHQIHLYANDLSIWQQTLSKPIEWQEMTELLQF